MNGKKLCFIIGFMLMSFLLTVSFDFSLSPLCLLPLFFLAVTDHPPFLMGILLLCGLCEDVFLARLLGTTPLLTMSMYFVYKHAVMRLLTLENFYVLWAWFILSCLCFQGCLLGMYVLETGEFPFLMGNIIPLGLTASLFPFLMKIMRKNMA